MPPAPLSPPSEDSSIRLNFAALLGFGDALISLQLLARAFPNQDSIRVLGTDIVSQVQDCVLETRFPIEILLPEHAAFFNLRRSRLTHSLQELLHCRRWSANNLGKSDWVLFEKADIRNQLLLGGCQARRIEPRHQFSIYQDRALMLEAISGRTILPLPACKRLQLKPANVLINPASRVPAKAIPPQVLVQLYSYFRERDIRLSLMDPESKYESLASDFDNYIGPSELGIAITELREHDLYLGADSFFIHLAYYFGIPSITVLNQDPDFYFAPPGCRELQNYLTLANEKKEQRIQAVLDQFIPA